MSFWANGIIGGYTTFAADIKFVVIGTSVVIGEYILSVYDASWSTKEIDQQGLGKNTIINM